MTEDKSLSCVGWDFSVLFTSLFKDNLSYYDYGRLVNNEVEVSSKKAVLA